MSVEKYTQYIDENGRCVLPEGIEKIEIKAFKDCKNLKEIVIPDSVTSIGDRAFDGCIELKKIICPKKLIGKFDTNENDSRVLVGSAYVPAECVIEAESDMRVYSGLRQYINEDGHCEVPDTITEIKNFEFISCGYLKRISIPASVTSIGDRAFEGCSNLIEINIPDEVTFVGWRAFYECSNLKGIHIPDKVESIEKGTFFACKNLIEIHIPDKVKFIGIGAFCGCSSLKEISIPDKVTSIENYLFCGCSNLKEIHIPDEVKSIGSNAFENCSKLTEIHIPDKVKSIGDNAFKGCSNLTKIHIPDEVKSIGNNAFEDCGNLTEIRISDKVKSIGCNAFDGCNRLKRLICPKRLIEEGVDDENGRRMLFIGDALIHADIVTDAEAEARDRVRAKERSLAAEYDASNKAERFDRSVLRYLHIPQWAKYIASGTATSDDGWINMVKVGENVVVIQKEAFMNCPNLEWVNFSEAAALKTIEKDAFAGCDKLKIVAVPSKCKCHEGAFPKGCKINKIDVEKNIQPVCANVSSTAPTVPLTMKENTGFNALSESILGEDTPAAGGRQHYTQPSVVTPPLGHTIVKGGYKDSIL